MVHFLLVQCPFFFDPKWYVAYYNLDLFLVEPHEQLLVSPLSWRNPMILHPNPHVPIFGCWNTSMAKSQARFRHPQNVTQNLVQLVPLFRWPRNRGSIQLEGHGARDHRNELLAELKELVLWIKTEQVFCWAMVGIYGYVNVYNYIYIYII